MGNPVSKGVTSYSISDLFIRYYRQLQLNLVSNKTQRLQLQLIKADSDCEQISNINGCGTRHLMSQDDDATQTFSKTLRQAVDVYTSTHAYFSREMGFSGV